MQPGNATRLNYTPGRWINTGNRRPTGSSHTRIGWIDVYAYRIRRGNDVDNERRNLNINTQRSELDENVGSEEWFREMSLLMTTRGNFHVEE